MSLREEYARRYLVILSGDHALRREDASPRRNLGERGVVDQGARYGTEAQ